MQTTHRKQIWTHAAVITLCMLMLAGCGSKGSKGAKGPPGDPGGPGGGGPTPNVLLPTQDAPSVNLEVVSLSGASGAGGAFQPGDTLTLTFTATKDDGSSWMLDEFDRLRILVGGPTFNYQRVLAEVSDAPDMSVENEDGSFSYTFAAKIPKTYLPPLNDTDSFGPDDGELTGEDLLDGTYTIGMYARWPYTVGSDSFREVGNTTYDFLIGNGSGAVTPRELVTQANCNACHSELQAHGGQRRDVTLCLLCHTNGAEDRNDPAIAGGTPGASVAMGPMIHKIHNGSHLPSVLGIGVNPNGTLSYDETPEPYQLVGFSPNPVDFSGVVFPVWPNLAYPMPKDEGYSALSPSEQALDDSVRTGVTACDKCHGDPDGAGPLPAPAQGQLAYQFPTRRGCASCHDDWDPTLLYKVNTFGGMAPQANDASCTFCHAVTGGPLAVVDAHLHPLLDPDYNAGLNFTVTDVSPVGFAGSSIDVGSGLAVTMTVTDDAGLEVDPADIASMDMVVSGPTSNMQLLNYYRGVSTDVLSGPQPYTFNMPALQLYEFVGLGTAGPDVFTTDFAPHWDALGESTTVRIVTGFDAASDSLAADVPAQQNFIDLDDAGDFLRDDVIVIDSGQPEEEYLVVQYVDGDRLWFSSPYSTGYPAGTRLAHPAGATVDVVLVASDPLVADTDYTLADATGTLTELGGSFTDGFAVLVSYTTDFRLPASYPLAPNDSPDLGEAEGQWLGLALQPGTYRLSVWGYTDVVVDLQGETQSYRGAAMDDAFEFLVGAATTLEPWELISSAENCYSCHDELRFHGGSRAGLDTCLACHGLSGAEDRPQYIAANAPATTGVDIGFREMIHKIHAGSELANGESYTVVGFGIGYPNNFSEHHYDEVVFPAMPDGAKTCATCHGADNEAWLAPAPRNHPDQSVATGSWSRACGGCHDSDVAQEHIELNTTTSGLEACAVCHGEGKDADVSVAHKVR